MSPQVPTTGKNVGLDTVPFVSKADHLPTHRVLPYPTTNVKSYKS